MPHVIIAIGSCVDADRHLPWARQQLEALLQHTRWSRIIRTPDVRHGQVIYSNQLVCGQTSMPAGQLEEALKQLERLSGRTPQAITLDLDLMQYDTQRHHLADWPRPYIQQLLPDIL